MIKIEISNTEFEAPYLLRLMAKTLNDMADWRDKQQINAGSARHPAFEGVLRLDEEDKAIKEALRPHVMDEAVELTPYRGDSNAPLASVAFTPLVTPEEVEQLTAPAPLVTGIEVDSAGNAWDGRIHASSRAKIADGTWRMKRGVAPELIEQVTAEVTQTAEAPRVPSPSLFAEPVIPPAPLPSTVGAVVPPPPAPSTVTATTSPTGPTFQALVQAITAGYVAKTVNKAAFDSALAQLGIPSLPMLQQRPDLLQPMATLLGITV